MVAVHAHYSTSQVRITSKPKKILMQNIRRYCVILCFFFQAEGLEECNEVVLFSQRIGFKYLNVINLSETKFEKCHVILKHFRSRVLKPSELSEDVHLNMDSTVILTSYLNLSNDATEVLKQVKIGSLLWFVALPIDETDLENFSKSLKSISLNLKFYIGFKDAVTPEQQKWKEVFKLNTNPKVIINNVELPATPPSAPVIVHRNLQGLTVGAISISWPPEVIIGKCKNAFKDCKTDGLLSDYVMSVAKEYNFTVKTDVEPDANWGMDPISGPRNLSGQWTGVVGGVVNKKYQIALSSWVHTADRNIIMDMIPIGWIDREVLLIAPSVARADSGLYTRPFNKKVWFALGGIMLLGGMCILIVSMGRSKHVWSKRIALLSLSYFFVLLESYYGGALTMFFSTDPTIPFESIHDVLRSYPDWKMLCRKNGEIAFRIGGEAGDIEYAKYYKLIQANPEAFTYTDLSEAINRIKNKKEIVYSWHSPVSNLFKERPQLARGIKQFARFNPINAVLALQKNSPMSSLLKKGFIQVTEGGVGAHYVTKWLGRPRSSTSDDDGTMVLEIGDVFLVFALISGTIIISITLLGFEYLAHLLNSRRLKSYMKGLICSSKIIDLETKEVEWKGGTAHIDSDSSYQNIFYKFYRTF